MKKTRDLSPQEQRRRKEQKKDYMIKYTIMIGIFGVIFLVGIVFCFAFGLSGMNKPEYDVDGSILSIVGGNALALLLHRKYIKPKIENRRQIIWKWIDRLFWILIILTVIIVVTTMCDFGVIGLVLRCVTSAGFGFVANIWTSALDAGLDVFDKEYKKKIKRSKRSLEK